MNSHILPPRANRRCIPVATGKSKLRHLASALTVVLSGAIPLAAQTPTTGPNGEDIYNLSGNPGGKGTKDNPGDGLKLHKNDVVILDASQTTNGNFTPFTPWVAIAPSIQIARQVSNGDASTYEGRLAEDPSLRTVINPYARLNELIGKTPALADLMPTFFTQSDPVYISKGILQSNDETPDWIKNESNYGTSLAGYNVWPISLYSSDAFDSSVPLDTALVPRGDMQNAAWVVLTSSGETPAQRVQLMSYFGDYSPVPAGSDRTVGNYSMITLEHVIFYGGRSTSTGGAILFKRTENITRSSNRSTVNVKGDVAFVANQAAQLGGAINAQESFLFDGNAYFVGNMAGASYNTATGGIFLFDTAGSSSHHGSGGAIRLGSGSQVLTFNKDAIFIGNLAAGEGGALSLHNGATVYFNGKAVFMGNMSGLFAQKTMQRGGGSGGAIVFGDTANNKMNFQGESYFIGNQAGGFGGAIATSHADNSTRNNWYAFYAPALFTDNISGYRPETAIVEAGVEVSKVGGVFTPPANISGTIVTVTDDAGKPVEVWRGETTINVFAGVNGATGQSDYGAKVRGGGAAGLVGDYLFFGEDAPASFLRNQTNGNGGALYLAKNNTLSSLGLSSAVKGLAGSFLADASFIGNVADVNGGAIQTGIYGAASSADFVWNLTGTVTSGAIYFGSAGTGSTLTLRGNISYSKDPVKAVHASKLEVYEMPLYGGGGVFSIGGLYVDSLYSITANQTKGSGGGILIGTGAPPALVNTNFGNPYSLTLTPLDWQPAGTYSQAGDFALLKGNVAMRDGGAIASYGAAHLLIGSGAKFANNYAGGEGGAIALGIRSDSSNFSSNLTTDAPALTLAARTAGITFTGNRAGVTIDDSQVDIDAILDPLNTTAAGISATGYMTADDASGRPNDIYVGPGILTGTAAIAATINIAAYTGRKISFDGGIEMDNSAAKNLVVNINTLADTAATSLTGVARELLADTTPSGLVVFDNASADIEGVTTVAAGTLRISGTAADLHWGTGTSVNRAGTLFDLQGPATLEANAAINAETIRLGDGATLRVLGGGALTLNTGAGGVELSATAALALAGNGRLNLGGTGTFAAGQIASISVGDVMTSHTAAQTLVIAKDASTLADLALSNATLMLGLFSGGTSDKIVAARIGLTGTTQFSLASLQNGIFTIATATGGVTDSSVHAFDYKGTTLVTGSRLTITATASGNDLTLTYAATSTTATGGAGSWTSTSAGTGVDFVLGDAVSFSSTATVSVDQNVGASGVAVTNDVTFTGTHGITTEAAAWGGGTNAAATGRLTMSGTGKTLTLANATGEGQRNEFTGGITITGGTVAAGNAAQLGAALSQINFVNTSGNGAALLVTGTMVLDGAADPGSQRLDIAAGNTARIATGAAGTLVVASNAAGTGTGGVFNVGAGSTLDLSAQGDMTFLGNTAASGGALALGAGATANIDVADGATVMFGLQADRVLRTAANTTAADSIAGAADSLINKTGAGLLSINSDSSEFSGTLNITAGQVLLGEGTRLGSGPGDVVLSSEKKEVLAVYKWIDDGTGAWSDSGERIVASGTTILWLGGTSNVVWSASDSRFVIDAIPVGIPPAAAEPSAGTRSNITVGPGALFGGAGIIGGNLAVNGGVLTIDGGGAGGIAAETAQTLTVNGDLALDGATVRYHYAKDNNAYGDNYLGADVIHVGGSVTLTGTTTLDFDALSNGTTNLIIQSGSGGYISLVGVNAEDISNGVFTTTNSAWAAQDFVIAQAGEASMSERYQNRVEYAYLGTTTVTSTDTITGTTIGTTFYLYDANRLQLVTQINNKKLYWTGESGSDWRGSVNNWEIIDDDDKKFAAGDSVVFGAEGYAVEGYAAGGTIAVDAANVRVADMTVTGTGNWTFTGGNIVAIPGANNYKDDNGVDLSTGQLVLDEHFTGTVTLANGGIQMKGITDATATKWPDVVIKNGVLEAAAGKVKGNTIINDSLFIFNQAANEEFVGEISGTGGVRQLQTGTTTYKLTLNATGKVATTNYDLMQGQLQVDGIEGLAVADTLTIYPGAGLLVTKDLDARLVVNGGFLAKTPISSVAQDAPTALGDSAHLRDPGVGDSTIELTGDYHGAGGILYLSTFRDAAMIHNVIVQGNSSGTTHVRIRNITSLDTDSDPGEILGTGTYFRPDGRPDSINPIATPKRDSLILATEGSMRNLKLIMDETDWAASILPGATVGSIVPFATVITGTYAMSGVCTVTSTYSAEGTLLGTSTSSVTFTRGDPIGETGTSSAHYFNQDGSIVPLVVGGTVWSGSMPDAQTVVASGTLVGEVPVAPESPTGNYVLTGTYRLDDSSAYVTTSTTTYAPSEIDYAESADNYKLVQGKNGNWYIRNASIAPTDLDLPMIGAAPAVADLTGWNGIKAVHQHLNARHDALEKGWTTWANLTHTAERIRKEYYGGTRIDQEHVQVGADYAFAKGDSAFGLAPSVSLGGAYSFTSVRAKRNDQSTLEADISTFTGYASARWWRLYLDALVEYSPDAEYEAGIAADVPFDMNGTVKGSRTAASAELGIIITPEGLGQLEIYSRAGMQKHDFGAVSSIEEPVHLTTPDGYNPIYDPLSPTGRRYHFDTPASTKIELGFRWGSHLVLNETWAFRPWAGGAAGRTSGADYLIWVDDHTVNNDLNGSYFTVQGGVAAIFRKNLQLYLTYGFTGGKATNNYSLATGVNYHW